MSSKSHEARILDQFTRQAVVFNAAAPISDAGALHLVVAACSPQPGDTALDVACGGGIVACGLASTGNCKKVVGCNLTPAMLENAKKRAQENGVSGITEFVQADALQLPFADASFDIVATRFSFHHMQDPLAVMKEMIRVCKPGTGRIVVVDMYSSPDPAKAAEFNKLEKLRDPSHVRALFLEELAGIYGKAGLNEPKRSYYSLGDEARNLLARSFPEPGDDEKCLEMFRKSARDDSMGIEVVVRGSGSDESIRYKYPVVILSSTRPAVSKF